MRLVSLVLIGCFSYPSAACARKPAYSNINVNRSRAFTDPQAPTPQPESNSNAKVTSEQAAAPQTPPAQTQAFKPPAFMDTQKGEAKDLPKYPDAITERIEYGPRGEGIEMLWLIQNTGDPIDRISDFYDKAIKSHRWEVRVRNRDAEFAEWRIRKGDREEGGVTVRPHGNIPGAKVISIVRTSTIDPKKQMNR